MHLTLRNVDLNLLVVFDALYRHRSVTLAANEVALSPSAFSHALNRLRESLNDQLFLRQGSHMQPTPRAEKMAPCVSFALSELISCLIEGEKFEPESSNHEFTFAVTDYTASVFLPVLISKVLKLAPNIKFNIVYSKVYDSIDDLISGKVDFAVGFEDKDGPFRRDIETIKCFTDDYVVAANKDHAFVQHGLTRNDYLKAQHVVVKPWGEQVGTIDRYLEKHKIRRNIAVELPSLMSALSIVAKTDLIITLPRRSLSTIFDTRNLAIFPAPVPTPKYTIKVYYNPIHCSHKPHNWLREIINDI